MRVIDREQSIRVIDKEEPSRTEHLICLNVVVGGGGGGRGPCSRAWAQCLAQIPRCSCSGS